MVSSRPEGSTGKALTVLGAGLLGGTLVAVAPYLIDGAPDSRARYGVVAAVSLTGVLGFVRQLRSRDRSPSREDAYPRVGAPSAPPETPTLTVRAGVQRRVELDAASTAPAEQDRTSPVRNRP
jgi:hypothetical protein